ncbi:MAG: patatin-like phospholipase family protein [Pseudomonadota bacterium]
MRSLILLIALAATACGSPASRSPISEPDIAAAAPYGIPGIVRTWGDTIGAARIARLEERLVLRAQMMHGEELAAGTPIQETALALSGGGADGAFGAGVLAGWSERGDRPDFDIVIGVSTGSIIGLFAFLGPSYDSYLREFYTAYSTEDLLEPAPFSALTGGTSLSDTTKYNLLIDRYIDEAIIAALAEEGDRGRILLIGTTNLDAARPVIWNVTEIARTRHPQAITLIRDLVRASSAIPAVFPPVVIPTVTADGRRHDELHVDGGATQQVMLFSPELPIRVVDRAIGSEIDRSLYIIINNSLEKPYEPVELGVLSIAGKAVSSLIGGSGSGDVYKIYAITSRDEIDFNLLWIPKSFDQQPAEPFDRVYMAALYEFGRSLGRDGPDWSDHPPNFVDRTAE